MEPDAQYKWATVTLDSGAANLLVTVNRRTEARLGYESHEEWNGWRDPLFTDALDVVEETLADWKDFNPGDMRPTFRLEMAYMLLWSSIERYLALRYHLGPKNENSRVSVRGLVLKLAEEPAFTNSLTHVVTRTHRIYRADDPDGHEDLNPVDPKKSVDYYYQVRSNITHRGKGVMRDHETLVNSLTELLAIFRDVLGAAKQDAGAPPRLDPWSALESQGSSS